MHDRPEADPLRVLAARIRADAGAVDDNLGWSKVAERMQEAADALDEHATALERAHVHGYDAGREDGVLEQRGDRRIGRAHAWREFAMREAW